MDSTDLESVRQAAGAAVRAALGSARSLAAIERWGGGAHNTGWRLRLDDASELFLKMEKENVFPRSRRCQIEREVYGIRLAAEAGLDVPEVIGYDFTTETAGCRYLLEGFIDRDLLGQALERMTEEAQAPLLAAFQETFDRLHAIRGDAFGELYSGGWLGRFSSWRAMMAALSTLLMEDADTLCFYSADEMATVREAHLAALARIRWAGGAVLTHNDLHIFNVFVEGEGEATRIGKIFDFGLSLFQAEYLSRCGQYGYAGKEADVARHYGVDEIELEAVSLVSGLEFVNFANAIRFAPDRPYGCVARTTEYLSACRAFLTREE